jgi:hypothetical protein
MTDTTPETFKWLEFHKSFQESTYGTDYAAFENDYAARTDFVHWNCTAAFTELAEALDETPWKPWSSRDKKEAWLANRDNFVAECVDVLFFLANALNAVKATDLEIAEKYMIKAGVNTTRQENGYNAHDTKCPGCKRELDKQGAYTITKDHGESLSLDEPWYGIFTLQCTTCLHEFDYTVSEGVKLP